jgi:hypothetical protein
MDDGLNIESYEACLFATEGEERRQNCLSADIEPALKD